MRITQSLRAAAFLILAVGATSASASVVFYTDEAAFNAAAGSTTTCGFDDLVTGGGSLSFATAAGLTIDGINFVGTTGNPDSPYSLGAAGPDFFGVDYNHVPGASSIQGPALSSSVYGIVNGVLTIAMPTGGVTAFGLQVFDVLTNTTDGSGTDTVNLNVNGTTQSVVTPAFRGAAFVGFISTSPITSVTLTGTSTEEFPTLSSVTFAVPEVDTTTPEPATFGLMALAGVGALTVGVKKRLT